jgi:enamine deaminase RidA (YjgF/YER057c/UK114 family)
MSVRSRLQELGIELPETAPPVGAYVPATQMERVIVTSGQLPVVDGRLTVTGKVADQVPVDEAAEAARLAVINALAAVAAAAGDIDRVERIIRLGVFVNSSPGFGGQAKVADGASNFLIELFGEQGKHVRAAVGAYELPLNAPVELELMVRVRA